MNWTAWVAAIGPIVGPVSAVLVAKLINRRGEDKSPAEDK